MLIKMPVNKNIWSLFPELHLNFWWRDEVLQQAERELSCLEVWNLPAPTFLLTRAVLSWEGFPNSNPEIHRVVGRRMLVSHIEAHNNLWLTHKKGIFYFSPGTYLVVSAFFLSVLEHPKSPACTLSWASGCSLSASLTLNSPLTPPLPPWMAAFGLSCPLTYE